MNLLHSQASIGLVWLGWLLFAPALLWVLRGVRRHIAERGLVEHAWLGGAVCVALLWMLEVRIGNGPGFGMLGCGLYALVFGRDRAILGLTLALVLHTALNDGAWANLGLNGVLFAMVPALIAGAVQRRIETYLPHNVFVFIIGNGMFATLAATVVTSLALIGVSLAGGASHAVADLGEYVGAAMLLAWSEAIVSGMLFSALVIFLPAVVLTFRQDVYLPRR
ncbi:MAG TPA: energy-coupling factor ABC transporter permease [Burkholderiaceae bacterium]